MGKDGFPEPPRGRAPATPSRSEAPPILGPVPPRRVLLIGFGHVGRALAARLVEEGHGSAGFPWSVVGVVDSRGAVFDDTGVDLDRALRTKSSTGHLGGPLWRPWDALEAIHECRADVVVEVSVSDGAQGEPGTRHLLAALASGADVVTSNKGPFALRYADVVDAARRYGRIVRYGTTVGGIVPVLETLVERLPAAEVEEVRGVLNGTTQFVLSQVQAGVEFPEAVAQAQRLGLTEADPSRDLDGHDAALKAAIVHNSLFAPPISAAEIPREGLRAGRVPRPSGGGRRELSLVSLATIRRGSAEVRLVPVDPRGPWAVPGPVNTIEVKTSRAGALLLRGTGAGAAETAAGILADLLAVESARGLATSAPGSPLAWLSRAAWPPVPPRARPGPAVDATLLRPPSSGRALPPIRGAGPATEEVRAW